MSETFLTYWSKLLFIVLSVLLFCIITKLLIKLLNNRRQLHNTTILNNQNTKGTIPDSVIKATSARVSLGPGKIVLIGRYRGFKAYSYEFEEPLVIGLPEIYIKVGPFVRVVKGFKAEKVLGLIK